MHAILAQSSVRDKLDEQPSRHCCRSTHATASERLEQQTLGIHSGVPLRRATTGITMAPSRRRRDVSLAPYRHPLDRRRALIVGRPSAVLWNAVQRSPGCAGWLRRPK